MCFTSLEVGGASSLQICQNTTSLGSKLTTLSTEKKFREEKKKIFQKQQGKYRPGLKQKAPTKESMVFKETESSEIA